MKKQVKIFAHFCDKENCEHEIKDFAEYKNTCFICHKEFCDEHIAIYNNFDLQETFAICSQCFNRLSDEFEKYISESEQE